MQKHLYLHGKRDDQWFEIDYHIPKIQIHKSARSLNIMIPNLEDLCYVAYRGSSYIVMLQKL